MSERRPTIIPILIYLFVLAALGFLLIPDAVSQAFDSGTPDTPTTIVSALATPDLAATDTAITAQIQAEATMTMQAVESAVEATETRAAEATIVALTNALATATAAAEEAATAEAQTATATTQAARTAAVMTLTAQAHQAETATAAIATTQAITAATGTAIAAIPSSTPSPTLTLTPTSTPTPTKVPAPAPTIPLTSETSPPLLSGHVGEGVLARFEWNLGDYILQDDEWISFQISRADNHNNCVHRRIRAIALEDVILCPQNGEYYWQVIIVKPIYDGAGDIVIDWYEVSLPSERQYFNYNLSRPGGSDDGKK